MVRASSSAISTGHPPSPHYSQRFVATAPSRVVRPAHGAVRIRGILVRYVEGPRGEPAGRRLIPTADWRLQQKRSGTMQTTHLHWTDGCDSIYTVSLRRHV